MKLDDLFKFVEGQARLFGVVDVAEAEMARKYYLKRAGSAELMSQYFYVDKQTQDGDSTKDFSFEIIDTSKYLVIEDK